MWIKTKEFEEVVEGAKSKEVVVRQQQGKAPSEGTTFPLELLSSGHDRVSSKQDKDTDNVNRRAV